VVLYQHVTGRSEKNHKYLSQDSWLQGWESNLGLPQYEAGIVTTGLQCTLAGTM
jgi:hypothetical protein